MRLVLISILFLTGCYEGWEYDRSGLDDNIPTPTPADKPIYYTLFTPIYPGLIAMGEPDCGVDDSFDTYRQTEWSLRADALAEVLRSRSEHFVRNNISISSGGCSNMLQVNQASADMAPWEPSEGPTQPDPNKRTLHVKAVFWDGDASLIAPFTVNRKHWQAWQNMVDEGVYAESINYFVLSNTVSGYFSNWSLNTDTEALQGTPIDNPDPSVDGITVREQIIQSDTEDFVTYLMGVL